MQDYSLIAGFSLALAGQRVSMHKCGSDPPNAGHLAPMHYSTAHGPLRLLTPILLCLIFCGQFGTTREPQGHYFW